MVAGGWRLFGFRPCFTVVCSRIRPYTPCQILVTQIAVEWGNPLTIVFIIMTKIIRCNRTLKCYAGKVGATGKSIVPNVGNAVG